MDPRSFSLTLHRDEGYRFTVTYDDPELAPLVLDEPRPLGEGRGPNAARILGAAIGNCLSASLLFCLEKARVDVQGLKTSVEGTVTRNERGRLRVDGIRVRLELDLPPEDAARIERCRDLFEDYCLVTQSVRQGLSVDVELVAPAPAPASASA